MATHTDTRRVASAHPSLSDATNDRLTAELHEVVGEPASATTPAGDRAPREQASRAPLSATLITMRLGGIMTAGVLLITAGIWWVSSSQSVLVLIPVFLVLLLFTAGVVRLMSALTYEGEHAAPGLSAQLQHEGVGDPDRYVTDLVADHTPATRRPGLRPGADGGGHVSADETAERSA